MYRLPYLLFSPDRTFFVCDVRLVLGLHDSRGLNGIPGMISGAIHSVSRDERKNWRSKSVISANDVQRGTLRTCSRSDFYRITCDGSCIRNRPIQTVAPYESRPFA